VEIKTISFDKSNYTSVDDKDAVTLSTQLNIPGDDVYIDSKIYTAKIIGIKYENESSYTAISGTGVEGDAFGEYEVLKLHTDYNTSTITVNDTPDITTVSITSTDVNEDSKEAVFTVQLSNAPDASWTGTTTAQVEVDGTTHDVTIDATGKGTLTIAVDNPDAYIDPYDITATVTGITGGNYEEVSVAGATVTETIEDTPDIVNITTTAEANGSDITFHIDLTPQNSGLSMDGGVYNPVKMKLVDASGADILDTDGNVIEVEIPASKTSEDFTFDNLVPGDYTGVKFTPTSGVKINPNDLEDSSSVVFEFSVVPPLSVACLDVQEDLDICDDSNLFVNEEKFNLHVSDKRADYKSQLLTLEGKYGVVDINTANGDYKYTLVNDTEKYTKLKAKEDKTAEDDKYIAKYDLVQGLREDQTETEEFEVGVGNNRGFVANKMVIVKVHGHNDIPVANNDDGGVIKEDDAPKVVNVLANDTDIDTKRPENYIFTLDSVEPTKKGYVHIVDNKLVFDPNGEFDYLNEGQSDEFSVKYSMSDEQGATSSAYVNFSVKGTGAKPCPLEVVDDCLFIDQNKTVTIDVLANDKGTGLKIVDVSELDGGEVQIVDGKLKVKYTAPSVTGEDVLMSDEDTGFMINTSKPFLGTDTFTYTVEDSAGERATATVSPHIKSISENRDDFKGTSGSDFVIAGKGNDYLSGGKGNDYYYFSKGDGADTVMDSSGDDDRIIFTPDNDKKIQDTLKFTLESDGDLVIGYGDSDTITVKYAEENGHKRDAVGVERIVKDGETYLSENDIDKIIQTLSSSRGSEMDISTMNEQNKDNAIGQIVWHQG
jgi:hypothetical protein